MSTRWSPLKECAATFVNEGVTIKYGDFGGNADPQQQVAVLLHGLMCDSSIWGTTAANLVDPLVEAGLRVITPDLRGHGLSDKPNTIESYGLKMQEDLIKLLDGLNVDKVHLLGHSLGGSLALHVAVAHTSRVQSLVIVSTVYSDRAYVEQMTPKINRIFNLMKVGYFGCCCCLCQKVPDPRVVHSIVLASVKFMVCKEEHAKLEGLPMRVLGMTGDKDTTADPKAVREFEGVIPTYECIVIPGADHSSVLTSESFRQAALNFIKSNC